MLYESWETCPLVAIHNFDGKKRKGKERKGKERKKAAFMARGRIRLKPISLAWIA
jgi:hypothetical protein